MKLAAWGGIAVTTVALALSGQGAAQASTAARVSTTARAGSTSGNGSIASGNQLGLPISVPIDLCGNVVAVLGLGHAECTGGASVASGASGTGTGKVHQAAPAGSSANSTSSTSGSGGLLSGNQISVPVTVPVTVCGNGLSVLGTAAGTCQSAHQSPAAHCSCRMHHHMAHHRKPQRAKVTKKTVPAPHPETIKATGILPITGVNLAGMSGGAAILLALGGGTLLGARRRG
jgi:hypothetical protein